MSDLDQGLLNDLITESNEHLENIEPGLLAMEEEGSAPQERINEIFRAIHSIKGGFGFFGLSNIQELSHKMESVLMRVRDGDMVISPVIIDALLAGVDKLRAMLDNVHGSEEMSISTELAPLKEILEGGPAAAASPGAGSLPAVADPMEHIDFAGLDKGAIDSSLSPGMFLYAICIRGKEDLAAKGRTAAEFLTLLQDAGVIVHQSPGLIDCHQTGALAGFLLTTIMEPEHLVVYLDIPESQIVELDPAALPESEVSSPSQPESRQETGAPVAVIPTPMPTQADSPPKKALPKMEGAESLRVRINLLNKLMDLAGELVLSRNQIKQALQAKLSAALASSNHFKEFDQKLSSGLATVLKGIDNSSCQGEGSTHLRQTVEQEFEGLRTAYRNSLGFSLMDAPGLAAIMQNIDLVTSEIQNDIMNTRMQPVGAIFSKFSRVIRDISRKLGKMIDLTIEGEDVELDKSIIELLGDPLTHLIRNCADHGIELPEHREAAGKAGTGAISLKAYHEGGVVNIDVIDDGAGLDAEKIMNKAIEKGQVSAEEAALLSERESLALIFAPGLSTAEQVTDVSGRGVGMDVVKTNIEKLGGAIDIESTLGQGTRINLKLPLTLAIIPSLLFSTEGRLFAVPQVNIEELVRVHARDVDSRVENIQGKPVLRLREKLLPLVRLNEVLGLTKTWVDREGVRRPDKRQNFIDRRKLEQEFSASLAEECDNHTEEVSPEQRNDTVRRQNYRNALHILVLKVGANRYGLIVDRLLDNEEIVVKPLPAYLKDCRYYAGITIMGNGKVAMILDATGIAEAANLRFGGRLDQESKALARFTDENKEKQQMLLFHHGTGERFVLSLPMVARVEKVEAGRVEKVGEQEFLKYENSSLRILRLDEFLPVERAPERPEKFFVIVPKLIKDPMGIIAYRLEDIVETKATIDRQGTSGHGILGSIMHEDKMLLVMDLYSLFSKADPQWSGNVPPQRNLEGCRVLLAEDTSFFRAVVGDYLEDLGCSLEIAKDGVEAWEMLQHKEYDLLVTDIEMPKMNGIELTQRLRNSQKFKDMPIVALTALLMENDRQRILEAGVDAYEAKLDKEHLSTTLVKVLSMAQGGGH